jgi:DNA-binding transcriptional ArsR family regulator
MARELQHPPVEKIGLSAVYDAFSDPVRRKMVLMLADDGEQNCSCFQELGSKTNLSYHFARMREAGLTLTRIEGTQRFMQLRTDDLDARFPGLLDALINSVREEKREEAALLRKKKRAAAALRT